MVQVELLQLVTGAARGLQTSLLDNLKGSRSMGMSMDRSGLKDRGSLSYRVLRL